jgi:hypothetical protein
MKVKVFMNSAGHNHEREILRMMHDGIKSKLIPANKQELREWKRISKSLGRGAGVDYDYGEKYSNCDVAVMLGSWKPGRSNIHHIVRTSIVERSKSFICIETPLLGRQVFRPNKHQRVGINGFLNRDAIFGEDIDYPDDRLRDLGINYKGWKEKTGDKIIVAMQLAGDASLRHNDINQWCWDTIHQIREYSDRPIEIRTHPGVSDKGWGNHEGLFKDFAFTSSLKDISFVNGRDLPWEKHLKDAYCVVAYTSGLSIDAVVEGIPVIACDEGNFAWNIAERKLKNIENLKLESEENVQQWLQNLAYCQWTPQEMESGECWSHLNSSLEGVLKEAEEETED